MVIVPPGNYCCVTNPAKKDKNGEPVKDTLNQVRILYEITYLLGGINIGGGGVGQTRWVRWAMAPPQTSSDTQYLFT